MFFISLKMKEKLALLGAFSPIGHTEHQWAHHTAFCINMRWGRHTCKHTWRSLEIWDLQNHCSHLNVLLSSTLAPSEQRSYAPWNSNICASVCAHVRITCMQIRAHPVKHTHNSLHEPQCFLQISNFTKQHKRHIFFPPESQSVTDFVSARRISDSN